MFDELGGRYRINWVAQNERTGGALTGVQSLVFGVSVCEAEERGTGAVRVAGAEQVQE